jgi:hypothetical protein
MISLATTESIKDVAEPMEATSEDAFITRKTMDGVKTER